MITYGEKRAINELKHVLKSQWKNGMLPQIRFTEGQKGYSPDAKEWGVSREISGNPLIDTSGITQPPNIAMALWIVYNGSNNKDQLIEEVEELYQGLKRYHNFLLTERDPEGEGLAAIFHPWASGTDNSPCYDELVEDTRKKLKNDGFEQRIINRKDIDNVIAAYRPGERDYECYGRLMGYFVSNDYDQNKIYESCPFVVKDVLFNSILVESILGLANIADALNKHHKNDPDKAEYYKKESSQNNSLADKMSNAIRTKLWDEESGLFYNYDVRNQKLLKTPTIHSFSPLLGKIADPKQADSILKHIKDNQKGFQIPTVPLQSEKFENVRYWKGPIWPVTNWLIIRGIQNYDPELSQELRKQTIGLISEGFDIEDTRKLATKLMEYTSFGEEFTTPSKAQYCHGWLWDSGFVAIGWRHVKEKPSSDIWNKVMERKNTMIEEGIPKENIRKQLNEEFKMPFFDEYYAPISENGFKAGDPLGAEMMTWTAALFLDLL